MFSNYTIFANCIWHFYAMHQMGKLVIFRTVARRNMHKSGTLICGDIICQQYRHIMIIAII